MKLKLLKYSIYGSAVIRRTLPGKEGFSASEC